MSWLHVVFISTGYTLKCPHVGCGENGGVTDVLSWCPPRAEECAESVCHDSPCCLSLILHREVLGVLPYFIMFMASTLNSLD
jgi:hypothetical protein